MKPTKLNPKIKLPKVPRVIKKIFGKVGKVVKYLVILLILVAAILTIWDEIRWQTGYYDDYLPSVEEDWSEDEFEEEANCNVAGLALQGALITYIANEDLDEQGYPVVDEVASEMLVYYIQEAEKDEKIKAIILEIDSYGGTPVAAEEVMKALKKASKPTVALIREQGISAAYLAATGAEVIFASKNSDIGSIGITMSYLDYAEQNKKEGLTYRQLSSGKFKDIGDPDKPLTAEEKELLMRDINLLHENFIKTVAENRGIEREKIRELADGSSMLGQMALEQGLIDQIGGLEEVKEYLKEKIGEEIEICW